MIMSRRKAVWNPWIFLKRQCRTVSPQAKYGLIRYWKGRCKRVFARAVWTSDSPPNEKPLLFYGKQNERAAGSLVSSGSSFLRFTQPPERPARDPEHPGSLPYRQGLCTHRPARNERWDWGQRGLFCRGCSNWCRPPPVCPGTQPANSLPRPFLPAPFQAPPARRDLPPYRCLLR